MFGLLLMLIEGAISQTRSVTLLCFRCIVKQPCSFQIPKVFAAHQLTTILAVLSQPHTWSFSICIILASATMDFGNEKASHYIWLSQWQSLIECEISTAYYNNQALGVLHISSRVMQFGSAGFTGVLNPNKNTIFIELSTAAYLKSLSFLVLS